MGDNRGLWNPHINLKEIDMKIPCDHDYNICDCIPIA